ncbi:Dehydrogenase/reductase SDR family member 7B [Madurella mycetomatis]|uniref:Dehydrogenase/reductase SDR family member 7B n=1 Tax=Madurella mycetomatis TaxID=100816 RepID=A0A175W7H3_9PEZI|nr:Dehydrogenase/reductase SDR family member 7B [Madurella mycetomatis]
MADQKQPPRQSTPRFRTDIYDFILPKKFRGALQDKVVIITGAVGAIGRGLAESFAVAGGKLVLTYNNTPPPAELKERCERFGAAAVEFVKCNVGELEGPAGCEALVKSTLEKYGRVDVLINNAGANGLGPIDAQDPRDFIRDIAVNFHGPYYLMRLLIPTFRKQRSGCVLNIASRAGTVAIPYSTSYCASKAALINLTACTQKEMDVEELDDVHLYSLHPGGIKSAMTLKKYATESVNNLPPQARAWFANALDVYNDSPYLNGMVCVALATGVGKKVLRGKYFDVGQDLEDVLAQAEAIKADPDLYSLHTSFLGELTNSGAPPGGYYAEDIKFDFPGFDVGK